MPQRHHYNHAHRPKKCHQLGCRRHHHEQLGIALEQLAIQRQRFGFLTLNATRLALPSRYSPEPIVQAVEGIVRERHRSCIDTE